MALRMALGMARGCPVPSGKVRSPRGVPPPWERKSESNPRESDAPTVRVLRFRVRWAAERERETVRRESVQPFRGVAA